MRLGLTHPLRRLSTRLALQSGFGKPSTRVHTHTTNSLSPTAPARPLLALSQLAFTHHNRARPLFTSAGMVAPSHFTTVDTSARLSALRAQFDAHNIDGYLVPSEDAHASEYIQDFDKRRAYISGFTGSAGTAFVTRDSAWLWTDGRYFQQAEKQLSKEWTLMRQGLPDVKSWQDFLPTLPPLRIGLDPALMAITDHETLLPTLPEKSSLVPVSQNLIDEIWTDHPARVKSQVALHPLKYAGQSSADKLEEVRKALKKDSRWGIVVGMLDEVAWLLNLRGQDIAYNPVFLSFLAIPADSKDRPTLFVDIDQLPQAVYDYLHGEKILIEPYDSVADYLAKVAGALPEDGKTLVAVPSRTSLKLALAVGIKKCAIGKSVVADLKSIKNPTEIDGFRASNKRDGVALVRYFAWLDHQLQDGKEISEYDAAQKLEQFRSEVSLWKGASFETISSTGPNASIIHYAPPEQGSDLIKREQVYLCDSGGQYLDGTIDTTRTLHFGTPSDREKRCYTRVLQGHIAIDTAVFPSTTTGFMLDSLARTALWKDGLDYRHGTGHGIGSFMNVHEGPQGIGTKQAHNEVKLQQGMTLSNEPGYYEPGAFGIRIESVVVVQKSEGHKDSEYGGPQGFLRMERVTQVPIATNLVEAKLLSQQELEWLNAHNKDVWDNISGMMKDTGDERALAWLEKACEPLVEAKGTGGSWFWRAK